MLPRQLCYNHKTHNTQQPYAYYIGISKNGIESARYAASCPVETFQFSHGLISHTGSVNLCYCPEAVGVVTAIINATWASDESNFAGHYNVSIYSCLTVFQLTTQKTLKLRVAGQICWWHWFAFPQQKQYSLSPMLNIKQINQLETHKIQVYIKCWKSNILIKEFILLPSGEMRTHTLSIILQFSIHLITKRNTYEISIQCNAASIHPNYFRECHISTTELYSRFMCVFRVSGPRFRLIFHVAWEKARFKLLYLMTLSGTYIVAYLQASPK